MKIAVLLCLPAWCHGEHGLPRPSLVQVSSRGTAHAKAVADSMSSTLAGFQKFTDDLVDQYKKQAPPAESESYTSLGDETGMENHGTTRDEMGEDTRGAIEKVLEYIDVFFDDAVKVHDVDKATIQDCEERVCAEACNMDESKVTIATEYERLTRQKQLIQECLTEATITAKKVTEGCKKWDTFRMAEENELPDCVYRPDDDADEFCKQVEPEIAFEKGDLCDNKIKADENEDFDQLEVMEDCLEDMHDWLTSTRAKQHLCQRGGQQGLSCQSDVEAYHEFHCEYVLVLDSACDVFDGCIQDCNADCDQAQCDEIVMKSQARMADNETGERIKCLLKTLLNETVINKTEGLDACTNEIAASRYETWAGYFELTCQASADTPSYPQEVRCAERDQAVSPSTEHVTNLMELVPELRNADQSNPCATHAHWNSCAGGHLCLAGSGAACAENWIDETGSGAVCAEKWTDERCENGASKEKDCINVG